MHSITSLIKKVSTVSTALVVSLFSMAGISMGSVAFADDDTPPPCVAPADSTYGNGVHHPVGADAGMYTYNCDTDRYVSNYYTYNPNNGMTTPNYALNYAYDCTGGKWYMDDYYFNAGDSAYHYARIATSNPGLATNCPVVPSNPAASTNGSDSNGSSISNTGPGSSNATNGTITLNTSTTNNTNLSMSNLIWAGANSGNAFVSGNTTGGSATTGDATSMATILNLLQSSANLFGPDATMFTADINGDVNGDFMFDPSAIMNTGPGSTNNANNNLTVNTNNLNNTNAGISNNIDVGANSGNAGVSNNTTGGDATSGNANAVVNLMNLINSTISSGQSFIGTININGNLNGDILLPQGVLDQLLASTGPGSNNVANTNLTDNSTTTNNTNESIANNVTSTATTGAANVSGNTSGGSANSGTAGTNVTLLNLTGSNTVGKNDLLVFVNVLGKWVGLIMNAPQGSAAAELGGGITSTGPGSNNSLGNNITDNSNTTNNTNLGIANNVNVHAQSGDATVSNNTTGGNAKSGNANTAVNILNMEGSNVSMSNWFGVLFINVFGSWTGSFGLNTSAGDPLTTPPSDNPTMNAVQAANEQSMVNAVHQFASFVPTTTSGSTNGSSSDGSVLGTATSAAKKVAAAASNALPSADNQTHVSYVLPVLGLLIAGILLFLGERSRFFNEKH
jgi:hypothetical protein